ncbi:nicotinate-nucleotide--dimethylbenzimidazole phosphoribosyltransferase [Chitinophagaceae bacterium 26-R-25]|nr:nicotinate-nucleotide--dimethylbenzimidazole phosphoribosyltransferase [Chitinophagaceae bacterium 26-R-25]
MSNIRQKLQDAIDNKTKPQGALGNLEDIALQVGLIQNTTSPSVISPTIVVFAGDHGIAATGLVNPFPQAVTAQMVLNFVAGGAAINVFCKQHNLQLFVVDAGVNFGFDARLPIVHNKIAKGTANYLEQPAMTIEQCKEAIAFGKLIVERIRNNNCNCIGFGEMGIGNTSAAALLMSAITGQSIELCAGRGTGTSDEQLQIKIDTLKKVFALHQLQTLTDDPIQLLATVGGFEIAMIVGAMIAAAENDMIVVVDGFITTSALLIAQQLQPDMLRYCIFAHQSNEQAHATMLSFLGAKPLLHLGMRLGEGTGAALAMPLIQSAVNFLNQMASFESASISNKN